MFANTNEVNEKMFWQFRHGVTNNYQCLLAKPRGPCRLSQPGAGNSETNTSEQKKLFEIGPLLIDHAPGPVVIIWNAKSSSLKDTRAALSIVHGPSAMRSILYQHGQDIVLRKSWLLLQNCFRRRLISVCPVESNEIKSIPNWRRVAKRGTFFKSKHLI